MLECEIRDFAAQYQTENGAPEIVIEFEARLLGPHGQVAGSLDARQTQAASANSVASVVAAFDQAMSATLAQIVTWTISAPKPASR
jgi:ABC-type uncharacterized transport system auxiliary subunit